MRYSQLPISGRWFNLVLLIQICAVSPFISGSAAALAVMPPHCLEKTDTGWTLEARGIKLRQILAGIESRNGITVTGLETRDQEAIDVRIHGASMESVLKRFLRQLGVENYAIEYSDQRISRISVFHAAAMETVQPGPPAPLHQAPAAEDNRVSAVEVIDVVDGSQAQAMGLQKGDIILSYDDIHLEQPAQLVAETEKRPPDQSVEIRVFRDGIVQRFTAEGGYIGVRIRSKLVPKENLPYE